MKVYPFLSRTRNQQRESLGNPRLNVKPDWSIFRNIPFWINDPLEHQNLFDRYYNLELDNSQCCFNHLVGLPIKKGRQHPLYQYELEIEDAMKYWKRIYILKARGIGITEFLLRKFSHMATFDNTYQYNVIPIIVGPNIQLAIDLIDRVKGIFRHKLNWNFPEAETRIIVNNVKIQAFPSHNPSSYRGRKDVPAVLIDEADFFSPRNQQDALDAAHGYRAKTDPWIFLVSTPDAPRKLMEQILKDQESKYKKFLLDYTIGLEGHPNSKGRIFTQQEIADSMLDAAFEREMNLKFLGRIGNVFHLGDIDYAVEIGRDYDPSDPKVWASMATSKILGVDPGSTSSASGFVVIQYRHPYVEVLYADDIENATYEEVTSKIYELMYHYEVDKVYLDSSNPFLVKTIKNKLGDLNRGYEWRKDVLVLKVLNTLEEAMIDAEFSKAKVISVNYSTMTEAMLAHTIKIMEKRVLRINPRFDKLVTALKTAQATDLKLDKDQTSFNDIFDAFRQTLINVQWEPASRRY